MRLTERSWLLILCKLCFTLLPYVDAYYGDPTSFFKYPMITSAGGVAIGNSVYILGGSYYTIPYAPVKNVTKLTFDSNNNVIYENILPSGLFSCTYCTAYSMSDNNMIAIFGAPYAENSINGVLYHSGLSFYNISNNSVITPQNAYASILPYLACYYSSAISPKKDAIYVIGGNEFRNGINGLPGSSIYRLDLTNLTSVTNMTAINPTLALPIGGGSAEMLPDGKMVIAFGLNVFTGEHYPTNQVIIFDTVSNTMYNQSVSGVAPPIKAYASSSLGPDQTSIYYHGGSLSGVLHNPSEVTIEGLVMLNTTTWEWISIHLPGLADTVYDLSVFTLFESVDGPKFLLFGGISGSYAPSRISVLSNVPKLGQSIQESGIQWFTNNPETDSYRLNDHIGLSEGAKAGIALGVIIFAVIALILSYRFFPPVRGFFVYVQNEVIWNPRIGEPLWAETTRLLVRFVLLALLLALLVFLIIRAATSPLVTQQSREPVTAVQVPDARFCFNGFGNTTGTRVGCQINNGTFCDQYVQRLDMSLYSPRYYDKLGLNDDISCFLFLPGPNFYLVDKYNPYAAISESNIQFQFFAPSNSNNTRGVVHMDLYPPGYDPNVFFYKLENDTIKQYLTNDQLRSWQTLEYGSLYIDKSYILRQTITTGLTYDIIEEYKLSNNGWNYIGLGSVFDKSVRVDSVLKDAPQNDLVGRIPPGEPIAAVSMQPLSFTKNKDIEQKVFNLVNTLAQTGGVFGLVVAIQTLLFGFRPQSPWGVVHRWAFGTLKISLTDRLANQFDKLGTPVPLVNPVNNRLSTLFKDNNPYSSEISSVEPTEDGNNHDNKIQKLEERLQLMELVLKSYYLNDEIFRSIDQAVKRNNEEKRRSSLGGVRARDTDSVLHNDYLNEGMGLSTSTNDKEDTTYNNVQRRPSGTVFHRDVYQPRLAPSNDFQYHDDV